jgi:hypothetical protein
LERVNTVLAKVKNTPTDAEVTAQLNELAEAVSMF